MDETSLHFEAPQESPLPVWLFHVIVLAGLGAPLLAILGLLHYIEWL